MSSGGQMPGQPVRILFGLWGESAALAFPVDGVDSATARSTDLSSPQPLVAQRKRGLSP